MARYEKQSKTTQIQVERQDGVDDQVKQAHYQDNHVTQVDPSESTSKEPYSLVKGMERNGDRYVHHHAIG